MPGRLHHVQWCVRSIEKTTRQLTQSYGFNFTHHRDLVKAGPHLMARALALVDRRQEDWRVSGRVG